MVKYVFALGAVLAMTTTCEAFLSPQSNAVRAIASIRRNISAASAMDQYSEGDFGDQNRKLIDAVENLGESFTDAILRDEQENDKDERMLKLNQQRMRQRLAPARQGWLVTLSMAQKIGVRLVQVEPGHVVSSKCLDVDTLHYQAAAGETVMNAMVEQTMKESLDAKFRGVVVLAVEEDGQGWDAGIRPGDMLMASSATVGDAMWRKSTLDGVKSAISSRKGVTSQLSLQFQRSCILDNLFELSLSRPIGIQIGVDKDGYVVVTGFNESASKLVLKGVQVGDRIAAVASSVGDKMWPVSTVEGVVSACTGRMPGQKVTMQFERPQENLNRMADVECVLVDEPKASVVTQKAISTTMTADQRTALLKQCRDVLKRYWSESKTDFVGKHEIPVLVADKVIDAIASASTSFDAVTLSMVMNAYLSCNKADGAIRIFQAATGFRADGSNGVIETVITGKEKGELLASEGALNLYTASSVMRAFAMKGDLSSAKRVLAALEGQTGFVVDHKQVATWPGTGVNGSIKPDTICYNTALAAAAAAEDGMSDLLSLFTSMSDSVRQEGGRPAKDLVSYNTVIAALDNAGRSDEAFEVFNAMKQAGIKPDKFTFTSLIKSCELPIDMQELLYDMKDKGVKPDIVTYNTMIRTLCDRLQWYEAKEMITDMESSGVDPNSMTYGFLMTGLVKAGKYTACLSLFESACADYRTLPLTENLHLYTTAISAAASLQNYEKAFDLVDRMKVAGVRPNIKTMSALMGACLSSDMTSLAVEVYKKIEEPDAIAMCKGLQAMCHEGQFEEVSSALHHQWRTRGSVMSGKQIMQGYTHLMRQTLEQGDLTFARTAFLQFLQMGFIPSKNMYETMIEGLDLVPPKKTNLPFAKEVPEEHFKFLLFVLDAIQGRNLACDGSFYSSLLLCSSRMGGLRRKLGSLLTEARALSESTKATKGETTELSWEDLLLNYDKYKDESSIQLPRFVVSINKTQFRPVLFAEQLVTHNARKSLFKSKIRPQFLTTAQR